MANPRGFGIAGATDHSLIGELARAAEVAGFESFWANDTPNGDGLSALAEAQRATRSIRLGVGVIPIDRKPAQETASQIETLGLDQRRLIVGIGSGGVTRGAVDEVRTAATELRERVDARIVIGALGPKMCFLGGRHADGALLNWLTPEQLLTSAAMVRAAATAGEAEKPWVGAYVRVALAGPGSVRLQSEAERYETFPSYAAHFNRMGVRAIDTAATGTPGEIVRKLSLFDGNAVEIVIRAITAAETVDDYLTILRVTSPSGDRAS